MTDAASSDPFATPALPVDDPDELAGVVDLFGALTREEVTRALVELAYRRRGNVDESVVEPAAESAVEWAVDRYYLVEYAATEGTGSDAEDGAGEGDDAGEDATSLVTVGPVAFPTLPPEVDDLPHILEYDVRSVSRATLARRVEERLRGDAARAVAAEDEPRVRHLLDVTYDLEAWAGVDVSEIRERLDAALAESTAE